MNGIKAIVILLIVVISLTVAYGFGNKITGLVTKLDNFTGNNPFDQSLNTTDNVQFYSINASFWYGNLGYIGYLTSENQITSYGGVETDSINALSDTTIYFRYAHSYNFIKYGSGDTSPVVMINGDNGNINTTGSINATAMTTYNMTMNSTGMYWLQGTSCKMRQFYNGTHWVTTGVC